MSAGPEAAAVPAPTRVRWFSRRAILLHLALLIWFPGCFVAMWWQVTVALAGNALGWLYVVEWPVFAIFGAIGWWQLVHDDEQTVRARRQAVARGTAFAPSTMSGAPTSTPAPPDGPEAVERQLVFEPAAIRSIHRAEDEDEELAAYNAYLARLATTGHAKTWRNPTGDDR